jgi:predicted nucleic acid-binding protein
MLRVMLDTNVLVKFAFIIYKINKRKKLPKNLKKFEIILEKLERVKFLNIMSKWSKLELRDVLMKLKLAEVYFRSGYTVDEFRDAKNEKIELNKGQIDGLNKVVFDIWKFCERTTKDMDMRKIERFTKRDFSSTDIILLHQAELCECDYFVTNDKKLYTSDELKKNFNVKICNVNEFITKI